MPIYTGHTRQQRFQAALEIWGWRDHSVACRPRSGAQVPRTSKFVSADQLVAVLLPRYCILSGSEVEDSEDLRVDTAMPAHPSGTILQDYMCVVLECLSSLEPWLS